MPNHQKPQRSTAGLHTTCAPGAHHGGAGCTGAHGGGTAGGGSALATPAPNPRMLAPRPPATATAAASRFIVIALSLSVTANSPHVKVRDLKPVFTTLPAELALTTATRTFATSASDGVPNRAHRLNQVAESATGPRWVCAGGNGCRPAYSNVAFPPGLGRCWRPQRLGYANKAESRVTPGGAGDVMGAGVRP